MTEKPEVPDKIWLKYHGNAMYPSVFNREPKDYDAIFIHKDDVEIDALAELSQYIIDAINKEEYFHSVELLVSMKKRLRELNDRR